MKGTLTETDPGRFSQGMVNSQRVYMVVLQFMKGSLASKERDLASWYYTQES